MCSPSNFLLGVVALIFPPLPVWVKTGICSADSLINILLCLLGVIPGLLHSWYIIAVTPDDWEYAYVVDEEQQQQPSRVDVYYVQTPNPQYAGNQQQPQAQAQNQQQQRSYGTVTGQQPSDGPSSGDVPPPYHEAVRGDNKVQLP